MYCMRWNDMPSTLKVQHQGGEGTSFSSFKPSRKPSVTLSESQIFDSSLWCQNVLGPNYLLKRRTVQVVIFLQKFVQHVTLSPDNLKFSVILCTGKMSNYVIIFPIPCKYFSMCICIYSKYFQQKMKFVENMVRTDNSVHTGSSFFSVES